MAKEENPPGEEECLQNEAIKIARKLSDVAHDCRALKRKSLMSSWIYAPRLWEIADIAQREAENNENSFDTFRRNDMPFDEE